MGKRKGKRALERCRRRWEDDFELNLEEKGRESVDWFGLAQNWVKNLRLLAAKCGEYRDQMRNH
jgi:hypothetical protein